MRTRLRDRSRAAGSGHTGSPRNCDPAANWAVIKSKTACSVSTGELADLAEAAARDAQRVLVHARRALRRAQAKAAKLGEAGVHDPAEGRRGGRLARAANDLFALLRATAIIAGQARQRSAGTTHPARGADLMGQLSARDHGLARVLLRCSYLCGGIAIRDPSSCSTRARPWTVLPPLRADDCDLRHITK